MKYLPGLVLSAIFSTLHAHADCASEYRQAYGNSLNHNSWNLHTRAQKPLKGSKEFTKMSLEFPIYVATITYDQFNENNATRALGFGSGAVTGLIATPFGLSAALVSTVPLAAIKVNEQVKYYQVPKHVRNEVKAIELMESLRIKNNEMTDQIRSLLDNDFVKRSYPSDTDAYGALLEAYQRGFFCPKDKNGNTIVMSYREIKRSIKDGSLEELLPNG